MQDLEIWNFAEDFTAEEAASLIVGILPGSIELNQLQPVIRRMRRSYDLARWWQMNLLNPDDEYLPVEPREMLESVGLRGRASHLDEPGSGHQFYDWLGNDKESGLETQRFGRQVLADWLLVIGMPSKYSFVPIKQTSQAYEPNELQLVAGLSASEIDPSDLPPELDAANMAFRAVTNGYGQSSSIRNCLIEYLQAHYPNFKPEQVQRIATVANPDKTTGRKKRDKE
jgi:hypothetical protein